jgi:copper chaperone CopZ
VHDCCANTDAAVDVKDKSQRAGMLAVGGSVLSALAASACCWIPLLLIALGVSAGGVSAWFEDFRLVFLGITAVLLGTGFYFVYFRKPYCAPGSACATPNLKLQRVSRVMLWVATVVVIATAAFPNYVGYLTPEDEPGQIVIPTDHVAAAAVGIEGMTCEACAILVRNALVKVPGVLDVVVSYPDASATVRFDKASPPAVDALASAVESAGYKADTSALANRTP